VFGHEYADAPDALKKAVVVSDSAEGEYTPAEARALGEQILAAAAFAEQAMRGGAA
jgi:hypothetical protein